MQFHYTVCVSCGISFVLAVTPLPRLLRKSYGDLGLQLCYYCVFQLSVASSPTAGQTVFPFTPRS